MPWPSCWCSWRLPPEVTGAALSRWREILTLALPGIAAADFDEALKQATIAWCFVSTAWLLPQALAGDPPSADPRRRPRPSRRALIQHRLSVAAELAPSSNPLGHLAQEALHGAQRCWASWSYRSPPPGKSLSREARRAGEGCAPVGGPVARRPAGRPTPSP